MELIDVVQQVVARCLKGAALTDLVVGTVSRVGPLEITEQDVRDPIPERALLLCAAVVEKKLTALAHTHGVLHSHAVRDTYTGGGDCGESGPCSEELGGAACYENGKKLPAQDGFIVLNRGLAVGDRVLMLRVLGGQSYLVLSRVYGGGGAA